jgi:hypothetical protein
MILKIDDVIEPDNYEWLIVEEIIKC